MKYEVSEILKVREDEESWVVLNEVRKIWKRRHRKLRVYSESEILYANCEDLAYVLTLDVVKVKHRKTFEVNTE